MAKKEDLIKYITKQVVTYVDTPQMERQERRKEQRQRPREHWMVRWFGLVPFSISMWKGHVKESKAEQPAKLPNRSISTLFTKWMKRTS
ncbi:YqzE family protein [Paenibacillus sp. SC116]|uniref:YqzE family protein n=1 Tax=Paenibacillus sp. SC116 TaxID=2968986 RepID=UPI00215A9664|nr:YqzE family protein [Paenibacillus sp. SC116]MCR8843347.1 YqzE family protein [Paenibacillus sp. SC116]